MYKEYLALNNLQRLICHKPKQTSRLYRLKALKITLIFFFFLRSDTNRLRTTNETTSEIFEF